MLVEREHIVTIIVAVIALLAIVGGYASFSGLSVYEQPVQLELTKSSFAQSDIFDANILLNPVTFLHDESIMIYFDNEPIGVVAIKKYLDDNRIEYGTEYQNLGTNNIQIMNLEHQLKISLADYITLESVQTGSHTVRVELSKGDASADAIFSVK